ncbi:MAG: ribosomal L7Ae/L30e/S12e/Gadd45 family protein [Ruminococcus sp.]|nr:ribosomal L7Ae/L30e/S12e/Gadd45 family protein [Ruminococcus sp.]
MSLQQKQKITNLLTICIKAGKIVKGYDSVVEAMKGSTVSCVMTAADISPKTLKETAFMCSKYNTVLIQTELTKEEIGQFAGKQTAVIAVCDKGFADKFMTLSNT